MEFSVGPHRRRTEGDTTTPTLQPTRGVSAPHDVRHPHLKRARTLAYRLLHKPDSVLHPVSMNLDAFFECFAAHHAIVDPLTGRFNLSQKEHFQAVQILTHMLERHGKDGVLPLSELESPSLSQRWGFMSKGVLSTSTCNRIIQLLRVSAVGGYVDIQDFIDTVLFVERRWRAKTLEIFIRVSIVTVYFTLGCVFYCLRENWSIMDSIYYITVSVSTIGYGDLVCSDDDCRLFSVFYIGAGIVIVVGMITRAIGGFLSTYQERIQELGKGIMELSGTKRRRKIFYLYSLHILYATLLLGFPLIIGSVLFYLLARNDMDVTPTMALYWAMQTCSTIGWGDVKLTAAWDKFWIVIYVFMSIAFVTAAIAQVSSLRLTIQTYKRQEMLVNKRLAMSLVSQLDVSGRGVDKFEFLAAMLVTLEKVKPEDVANILHQFDELDSSKRGVLTLERLASLSHTPRLSRVVSGIPSGLGRLTSDETLEGITRYKSPFAQAVVPEERELGAPPS